MDQVVAQSPANRRNQLSRTVTNRLMSNIRNENINSLSTRRLSLNLEQNLTVESANHKAVNITIHRNANLANLKDHISANLQENRNSLETACIVCDLPNMKQFVLKSDKDVQEIFSSNIQKLLVIWPNEEETTQDSVQTPVSSDDHDIMKDFDVSSSEDSNSEAEDITEEEDILVLQQILQKEKSALEKSKVKLGIF